jgi:hypothetical protein
VYPLLARSGPRLGSDPGHAPAVRGGERVPDDGEVVIGEVGGGVAAGG